MVADTGPTDAAEAPTDSGASQDAGAADASVPDTGAPPDSGSADTGVPDVGIAEAGTTPDAGEADAGAPADAGAVDGGVCNYIDLNVCVVDCGAYEYAHQFVDTLGGCPDYYRLRGNDYPDINAALAGESCNTTCIYKAFQSVSFIDHCGRRNGYIVFTAPDAGCADLYEFSSGLYGSVADWQAATPCPS